MKPLPTFLLTFLFLALAACAPGSAPVVATQPVIPTAAVQPTPQAQEPQASPTIAAVLPTATNPPMASLNDEAFDQRLVQAIATRNFEALRALMKERFSFATFNTELRQVTAEEALGQMQQTILAEGAQPAAIFGTDVVALLQGADPLALWGPVANPVRALHVMGLGANAAEEAVLVIGRDPASGQLYWHGVLLPQGGYFHTSFPQPEEMIPTGVTQVIAKQDLNVRSGPGTNYAEIGMLRGGEIAQVTGMSPDRAWWRIFCTNDLSGFCWISADPALTEPVS